MSDQLDTENGLSSTPPAGHTPGVAYEKSDVQVKPLLWCGAGLVVVAFVVHVVVWQLFGELRASDDRRDGNDSSLARDDGRRSLGERLLTVPPPHLQGIEPENSQLVLRTRSGEQTFYLAPDARVRIDQKDVRLFQLREGQSVTVTYHQPGGTLGSLGVVTSVTSPPYPAVATEEQRTPEDTRTLTGVIVVLEPKGIAASRQWAEVQMDHYAWADRGHTVVRIPVAAAIDAVLRTKEFQRPPGDPDKADGRRIVQPTSSNSGRGSEVVKP